MLCVRAHNAAVRQVVCGWECAYYAFTRACPVHTRMHTVSYAQTVFSGMQERVNAQRSIPATNRKAGNGWAVPAAHSPSVVLSSHLQAPCLGWVDVGARTACTEQREGERAVTGRSVSVCSRALRDRAQMRPRILLPSPTRLAGAATGIPRCVIPTE